MDDLISRQAAIDATWEEPMYADPINVLTEVRDRLNVLPTIELPMEHGHWKKGVFADITCSNCNFSICIAESVIPKMLYCPSCGARMDEVVKLNDPPKMVHRST